MMIADIGLIRSSWMTGSSRLTDRWMNQKEKEGRESLPLSDL